MKKFLILMLCIILICAMPTIAFATEAAEATTDFFTTEEIVTWLKTWVKAHIEEISVVVTLIFTTIHNIRKNKALGKSMTTVNNNAVTIATDSKKAIADALKSVKEMTETVNGYKEEIAKLLLEVRKNAEEKQALEKTLADVTAYLKTAKMANVEFADELAELLVLANIPNSVKEELYERHRKAVNSIAEAEKTEVVENETEEAVNAEAA